MSVPSHFERASPIRRFVAGSINLLIVGFCAVIAEVGVAAFTISDSKLASVRVLMLGLLTLYWLVCVRKRKSLGGAFCLIEARAEDFQQLSVRASMLRTLPFYIAAVIAYVPSDMLSVAITEIRTILLISLAVVFAADAVVLALSGRTVLDRLLRVSVWRLNLPDHLHPRLFGYRIV